MELDQRHTRSHRYCISDNVFHFSVFLPWPAQLGFFSFFFNNTPPPEISPLPLPAALPIPRRTRRCPAPAGSPPSRTRPAGGCCSRRRSEEHTSELQSRGLISYPVFCL